MQTLALGSHSFFVCRMMFIFSDFDSKLIQYLLDKILEEHWWRTIDYLTLVGAHGIVLNADKFQFCQREVDFGGFRITENRVEPLPKYLEAIETFPTPTKIQDIRSWFGLVNQVAHYNQLTKIIRFFPGIFQEYENFSRGFPGIYQV